MPDSTENDALSEHLRVGEVAEVGELLELRGESEASCAQVREIAEQKAAEVRRRISKLEEMLQGLESLTRLCPGDVSTDECPFLEILSDEPK